LRGEAKLWNMGKYKNLKKEYEELDKRYAVLFGEKSELAYELEALKASAENIHEQDIELQKLHEGVRNLKHDMKNHLMVIAHYLNEENYDGAKAYTSEILDKLNAVHSYIETGNSLLNHIVNEKLELARSKGIPVKAEIENLPFEKMGSLDFSALLTNLLDNAIEASEKETAPELYLAIVKRRGYQAIIVKNRISSSVLKENPSLQSRKEDVGNHGMGISQIKSLTERYGGISDFYEKDGFFCACSFIPE